MKGKSSGRERGSPLTRTTAGLSGADQLQILLARQGWIDGSRHTDSAAGSPPRCKLIDPGSKVRVHDLARCRRDFGKRQRPHGKSLAVLGGNAAPRRRLAAASLEPVAAGGGCPRQGRGCCDSQASTSLALRSGGNTG
jgi:hypothetical protein